MNETTPIAAPPQVPAQSTQVALFELSQVVARANAVQITNADEYARAVEICQSISVMKSVRENERLAITRKMDEAKNAVMSFFRGTFSEPLEKVDAIVRGKIRAYDAEQKRLADERRRQAEEKIARERAEAQRKAREIQQAAEEKARAERAEADRKRQEEERSRREAEELRRKGNAEAARAKEEEAARAATAASKAESRAESVVEKAEQKADAINMHAASMVAPLISSGSPKVDGKSTRKVWKWEVVDASKVDRRFLMLDESKIGQTVKALKQDADTVVGGIRVWEEDDLTIRRAKV